MNYHMTLRSRNEKTGPIPVSTSSAKTCPPSCPFNRGGGCYAAGGPLAMHWAKVTSGERGESFASFLDSIVRLPDDALWRHNQAGDLPGFGDAIDADALASLVEANGGRRGFTYTHKPVTFGPHADANAAAVYAANRGGFTVNVSANNLADADAKAELGIGPVVVVLPADQQAKTLATPEGRKVIVCPATYRDDVTCSSCGLCANVWRNVIVGFPAHGSSKRKASAACSQ